MSLPPLVYPPTANGHGMHDLVNLETEISQLEAAIREKKQGGGDEEQAEVEVKEGAGCSRAAEAEIPGGGGRRGAD